MSLAQLLLASLAAPSAQEAPRLVPAAGDERADVLASVLAGTDRALATLRECERRLDSAPEEAIPFLLRVTEAPRGSPSEQAERLAALRGEVVALLRALDELQAALVLEEQRSGAPENPIALGARPAQAPEPTPSIRAEALGAGPARETHAASEASPYSADPLRHGIACYRAGRYEEACQWLAPLGEARAEYWRARALERLERFDEAIQAMERAVSLDGEGFERRRAQTDLELLRWKRDYAHDLPGASCATDPGERRPQ